MNPDGFPPGLDVFNHPGLFGQVVLFSPRPPARWSHYLANPVAQFTARENAITYIANDKITSGTVDYPLNKLEDFFKRQKKRFSKSSVFDPHGPPFQGGAVGYLSFEALHYLEDVPLPKTDDVQAPWFDFLFFDAGIAFDRWKKKFHCFGPPEKSDALWGPFEAALSQLQKSPATTVGRTGKISSNFSKSAYVTAVKTIQSHIGSGETFQANLSQRFSAQTTKKPWDVFVRLNQINPSPYSAFFQSGSLSIVSASPELLFSLKSGRLVTRPIAGTRPRGKSKDEDLRLEAELKQNAKENAEHAMLVDLERNDVGRICNAGSVKVHERFVVETYSHVQHLVSQVEGELKAGHNVFDAIRALFPGGTITGCPKVRTMQILREVEPVARGPYTGSLGWIGWNGDAAFNILIRTIYFKRNESTKKQSAYFHAGGGIVYDSVPELEYQESLQKAEAMRLALQ